jgi:hypothetical protein
MTDPSKTTKMKGHQDVEGDPSASVIRRIRVRSDDSAFVYSVFEASEGVCAYSTLPHQPGDRRSPNLLQQGDRDKKDCDRNRRGPMGFLFGVRWGALWD